MEWTLLYDPGHQQSACTTALGRRVYRRPSARHLCPSRVTSVKPESQSHPRLAAGCRLGENNQQQVLLTPGRALRLSGPSLEIVKRCDGQHTVEQIIRDLQRIYWKAEAHKVESDILGYLALLHDQRALDFV